MDVLTPKQRRRCMSSIRGRDTKPELILRKALWAQGLRYRLNNRLPGRPDIIFPGKKLAIFVDGCFWHRCPLHFQAPEANSLFWAEKIGRNVDRDREVDQRLRAQGWQVLRVWEHEIHESVAACVTRITEFDEAESH